MMMCVGNDDDVRSVVFGDNGALAGHEEGRDPGRPHDGLGDRLRAKSTQKPKTWASASSTRPVSGGQAGAVNGQLGIMCGGEDATFAKAKPVIDVYAKMAALIGAPGAGQLTKMVNQICIAGIAQGLAEAVAFAKRNKLDVEKVIGVISKGAAQSWQMENRWKQMDELKAEGFGFATEWMRKDMGICLDQARKSARACRWRRRNRPVSNPTSKRDGGKRWDSTAPGPAQLLLKDSGRLRVHQPPGSDAGSTRRRAEEGLEGLNALTGNHHAAV